METVKILVKVWTDAVEEYQNGATEVVLLLVGEFQAM
jgi:hypothetical protein